MFLLLLAAVGIACLARRSALPSHVLVSPVVAAGAPSPILVLDGFLQRGLTPPPQVIMCAIAEAELMGRIDLANDLVRSFVLPVVMAAERDALPPVPGLPPAFDPDSYGYRYDPYESRDPYDRDLDGIPAGYAVPTQIPSPRPHPWTPQSQPQPQVPQMQDRPNHHRRPTDPRAERLSPRGAQAPFPTPVPAAHAAHEVVPDPGRGGGGGPRPLARAQDARVEILSTPRGRAAAAAASQAASQATAPAGGGHVGTLTVSGGNSPIARVSNQDWAQFVSRIAREQVTFTSPHHVGAFRQRRSRLAELGIDPSSVVGSPEAQAGALCADMDDAYRHATSSGLVAEYQGVTVQIPSGGSIEVTLSGVLGVIQAAGLEGAAGWLEDPRDRERFPHTTAAFLRTNGVF